MNSYTFQTIVAPAQVRADFTILRDALASSDKELMQAVYNIAIKHDSELRDEVVRLQTESALAKQAKRDAKREEREAKIAAEKAAKAAEKAERIKNAVIEKPVAEPAAESTAPAPEAIAAKASRKRNKAAKVTEVAPESGDDTPTLVVDGTTTEG